MFLENYAKKGYLTRYRLILKIPNVYPIKLIFRYFYLLRSRPLHDNNTKWQNDTKFRINWSKKLVFVHFVPIKFPQKWKQLTFLILLWFNWLKNILFYKKQNYICKINLLKWVLLYIILCHLCCHVSWQKNSWQNAKVYEPVDLGSSRARFRQAKNCGSSLAEPWLDQPLIRGMER